MQGPKGNSKVPAAKGPVAVPADLAPYIDHTLLKPETTSSEIERLCAEADAHKFKAVCVNPIFVRLAHDFLSSGKSEVMVASVIGFPLGASLTRVKALETELAIHDGADEIDMVIRIDLVKQHRWADVTEDIRGVVRAAGDAAVKVILETGLLSESEILGACKASEEAGAAFVKTATGFLGRGASIEDILLMRKACSPKMQIKASGGVKTFEQAREMILAGANRIGTSSGVQLVTGQASRTGY